MSPFDKLLIHPTPVNREAMRVAFGGGDNWEAKPLELGWETFDAPPASLVNPKRPLPPMDRTALVLGRMTVIGLHKNGAGGDVRWLCRCACGKYEIRSDESIEKQAIRASKGKSVARAKCAVCLSREVALKQTPSPAAVARQLQREKRMARIAQMVAETGKPWNGNR